MQSIWKYELEVTDIQTIRLPLGAKIISVAEQRGRLCLWAIVNLDNVHPDSGELVEIAIVGTGNPVDTSGLKFIGTVVMNPFVWHVFEVTK